MITCWQNNKIVAAINKFLNSIYYLIALAVTTVLAAIFGLEFIVMPIYALLVLWNALLNKDMLPAFPIAMFGFMIISNKTSDTTHNISSLSNKTFAITFYISLGLVVAGIITRVIYDIIKKRKELKIPQLLIGLSAIVLTFIIGGLFTEYKSGQETAYALLLTFSFIAPYLYFYLSIDWKEDHKDYIFFTLMMMGMVVAFEVFYRAIDLKWIHPITEYTIDGDFIKLGWGVKPEIGTMLAMSIPSFFYFINRKQYKYLYLSLSFIVVFALILLRARWPLAFGLITYIALLIHTFIKANKKDRTIIGTIVGAILLVGIVLMIIFRKEVTEFFKTTIEQFTTHKDSDEERWNLYKAGWNHFINNPVFGVGWYQCPSNVVYSFENNIIPPRYHDTFIQILACTGVIGMLAYGYHRYETIRVFIKKRSYETVIIGLSILMLLLGSLLDTHLFNIACTIQYSTLLVVMEKSKSNKVSA